MYCRFVAITSNSRLTIRIRTPSACAQSNGDEDELDAAEAFERMQFGKIAAIDPDSTAYHAALRKTGQAARARSPARQFGGVKGAAEAERKKEYNTMINTGLVR